MKQKDLYRIGRRIRKAREARQLTREQLAELVDLTDSYIGMLERGERIPRLTTFMEIIDVLEVTADDILCDVVDYVCKSRLAEYDRRIERLPKRERDRLFKIMDLFVEEF